MEAHDAEFRLDEAWVDLRDTDRLPIQLEPQGAGDRAHRVLGRGVAGTTLVGLEPRDRPDVYDVPMLGLAEHGKARPGHPHEPKHVDLPHAYPVLVRGLFDRPEAQRTARVVDQDVDTAEFLRDLAHERFDALLVRHIKRHRDAVLAGDPFQAIRAARADDDLKTLSAQRDRGGSANP